MNQKDFKEFSVDMSQLAKSFPLRADELKRKAALVALVEATLATPADTGRARANWQIGRVRPVTRPIKTYVAGAKGSTASQNSQRAIQVGTERLSKRVSGVGRDIYLTNNVPYIEYLNKGSSVQAPAKFVEAAIKRAISSIREFKLIEDSKL